MTTIVYQSFRPAPVPAWAERCLASVEAWAAGSGFGYRRYGDELFDRLPAWYRDKARGLPMVGTDLGRLLLARELLAEGFERAIWLDADVLVLDARALRPPAGIECAFAREVWVQRGPDGRLSAHEKVNNAFCLFAAGGRVLDFYAYAAESLVRRAGGAIPPTLAGPKLLAVLHNLVAFPLLDGLATLGPVVLADVLSGGGPALELLRRRMGGPIHAVHLGASLAGREHEGVQVDDAGLDQACERLTDGGLG